MTLRDSLEKQGWQFHYDEKLNRYLKLEGDKRQPSYISKRFGKYEIDIEFSIGDFDFCVGIFDATEMPFPGLLEPKEHPTDFMKALILAIKLENKYTNTNIQCSDPECEDCWPGEQI